MIFKPWWETLSHSLCLSEDFPVPEWLLLSRCGTVKMQHWVGFFCMFLLFFSFFLFFFIIFFFFLLFIRQCVFYGTCKSASSRGITAAPGSVALNTGLCRKDSSSRSSSYIKQRSAHGHSGSASGSSQGAVLQLPFLSLDVCLKRTSKDFSQELQSEFSSL